MATYYKYAEREAKNQIDWSEVGSQLTNTLKQEALLREAKKKALDDASRQFGEELENAPQGMSDDVNKYITDYAGDMQQYRLLTDRLLKSGQLKPKDYALIRQNSKDGTKRMFDLAKEYQDEFSVKTERRQKDQSSAAETQFMAMVEGFANLGQTKALINPTTGAISIGKMVDKNGVKTLAEGPDNYMTVNQLRNRIKEKIDKYQLNEALEGESKLLGDVVTEVVSSTGSSTQTGFLTKVTDPTKRKGLSQEGQQAIDKYIETEKLIVEAQLSNPSHVSSVLFDWTGGIDPKSGKAYQVTTDVNVAKSGSHYILWSYKDGVFQPDFESTPNGKEQYKTAEEYTKNKFRSMLEQKTEVQPFSQPRKEPTYYPPEYVYRRGDEKKSAQTSGNMLAKLYSGTPAEQQAAINHFYGMPNVKDVSRNNDGVSITFNDGSTKSIPFKNANTGEMMTQQDFVRSGAPLLLGGTVDINEVVKGALQTKTTEFQAGEAKATSTGPKKSADPNKVYADYLNTTFTGKDAAGADQPTDESDFISANEAKFNQLGFSVREAVVGKDAIVITNSDGKSSSAIYLSDPAKAAEKIKAFMLSNVPGASAEDQVIFLKGLQGKGILKGELD